MHRLFAHFVTAGLKVFALGAYVVWAVKLLVSESSSPLFGLLALVLSTYGLWSLVIKVSDIWLAKTSGGILPRR
jgi:hypothetical protein